MFLKNVMDHICPIVTLRNHMNLIRCFLAIILIEQQIYWAAVGMPFFFKDFYAVSPPEETSLSH